jgi:long-chain acyl-CoA synthetase
MTQREDPEVDHPSIGHMAHATAERFRDAIAFTAVMPNGMFGDLTFASVDRMSDAFAVYLREELGLVEGERVALQAPNGLAYPVVALGVLKAGCVLVNVNPLYTPEEMGRQFKDSEPAALVIVDMFAGKLEEAFRTFPIRHVVVTRVAEFMPRLVRGVIGAVQKHWDRSIPEITIPHTRLPETLARGEARIAAGLDPAAYRAGLTPASLACLQYTGGTTGIAKGAMLTHGNLLANMRQTGELVSSRVRVGEEVVLTALPMYHIFAFTVNFLMFFAAGARNVLVPNPRPLSNLKRAFENYRITWLTGVNTLFNGLLNEFWFAESPPKHLRASCAGGMALQGAVAERWQAVTGTPIIEGYGLSETSPVLTFNSLDAPRPGSIGLPLPGTDIAILDEAGEAVAPGTPGELAARGPQVMIGYWRRPDETAKVMTADGYFRTGDVAVRDPDGSLRIIDRKKDLIIVSGFNVFPNEVEDVLAAHEGILECAVIGVPDGAAGEAVKAYVVRRDPALTADAVREHCRRTLTAYKVPRLVEFRDELPKSTVGKILRKDLRGEELAKAPADASRQAA